MGTTARFTQGHCYTELMPDNSSPVATGRDWSRLPPTTPDQFTLTIEEAATRYEHAGHPRTIRSIQRYCAKGHLDCLRQETTFGDKFMISPESVARHIAQIEELASATRRDEPRPVATTVTSSQQVIGLENAARQEATTYDDTSRPDATGRDKSGFVAGDDRVVSSQPPPDARYVEQLEIRIGEKDKVISMLTSELDTKNGQIVAQNQQIGVMLEREKETNYLMQGFQKLMGLLPQPKPETPPTGETGFDQSSTS